MGRRAGVALLVAVLVATASPAFAGDEERGILAAIHLGINNGRVEGLNNRVRLIVRRAFGFHSPDAALALVMLTCGPITLAPPHERT